MFANVNADYNIKLSFGNCQLDTVCKLCLRNKIAGLYKLEFRAFILFDVCNIWQP